VVRTVADLFLAAGDTVSCGKWQIQGWAANKDLQGHCAYTWVGFALIFGLCSNLDLWTSIKFLFYLWILLPY
jgi:hypothetical protein